MANFRQVNKAVAAKYPDLDLEVVRGKGYAYVVVQGDFPNWPESILSHPTSTLTDDMIKLAGFVIDDWLAELERFNESR